MPVLWVPGRRLRRMTKPESGMAKQTGPASGRRKTARNAERRKRAKKEVRAVLGLPVLHADTAGIDIGATEIYVAVPADRDEEPVRCFEAYTGDLRGIAEWLGKCEVRGISKMCRAKRRMWRTASGCSFCTRWDY